MLLSLKVVIKSYALSAKNGARHLSKVTGRPGNVHCAEAVVQVVAEDHEASWLSFEKPQLTFAKDLATSARTSCEPQTGPHLRS